MQRSKAPRSLQWIIFLLLLGLIASGLPAMADYLRLIRLLSGKSLEERGHIACNGSRDFLELAGSIPMRKSPPKNTYVPDVWVWAERTAGTLPPEARIYVNSPSAPIYYYGNFFWFPCRLALNPKPVRIDGLKLEENWLYVPKESYGTLRDAGFTHVVEDLKAGPRLVDLRLEADERRR